MYQRSILGLTCLIFLALFFLYWGQIRIPKEKLLSYQKIEGCVSSSNKELSPFIADQVRIVSNEGVLDIQKAVLEKNTASCLALRGYLEKEETFFEADQAQIVFNFFQPQTIILDRAVRLFSDNHRYILADLAVIDFKEKKASLESIPPKRVLFQQDGIKMSAPQIWIEDEEVKGLGDVRLFFEPKEIEEFEKVFENLVPKK